MYPYELMCAAEATDARAPANRKRQLSPESVSAGAASAFPQYLLQSDPDAESDTDSDGSQPKRLRYDSSPSESPTASPSRKPASWARPNMSASHSITLEMLRPHFEEPLAHVAKTFGICVTLLKKICRKHGLSRWPHRQITGLRKSIASMEHAIGYFEGSRRDAYAEQLRKQKTKLALLLEDPTQCSPSLPSSPLASSGADAAQSPLGLSTAPSFSSRASLFDAAPAFPVSASVAVAASLSPCLTDHLRPTRDAQPAFAFSTHAASPPSRFPSAPLPLTFLGRHPLLLQRGAPSGGVCLPPLRMEPRRLLPPLASLVGNTGAW
ncbi:hypothetical protein PybrP1_010319 [[Pythium] brassicae (nom. inval.)]|nr:hypothetical protein PybrP1_010319 [[Pythium] brassicae (nom. inval.)]